MLWRAIEFSHKVIALLSNIVRVASYVLLMWKPHMSSEPWVPAWVMDFLDLIFADFRILGFATTNLPDVLSILTCFLQ